MNTINLLCDLIVLFKLLELINKCLHLMIDVYILQVGVGSIFHEEKNFKLKDDSAIYVTVHFSWINVEL